MCANESDSDSNCQKLSQGEIDNLDSLISIKEIEFVDLKISLPLKIN